MKKLQICLDIIIILLVLNLLWLFIFSNNKSSKENVVNYNDSRTLYFDDSFDFDVFTFFNTSILYIKDYKTTITVNIKNNSENNYFLNGINLYIYDENNKLISTIYGDSNIIINSNETVEYNFETSIDIISKCKNFKYEPTFRIYGDDNE